MKSIEELRIDLELEQDNSGSFSGSWLEDEGNTWITSLSPIDGQVLGRVSTTSDKNYDEIISAADENFLRWRSFPAPKRGSIVREIAEELRSKKDSLGQLVTLEMGKILPEGLGEIQEAIDIADFSVGLSRQLYGLSMHSEREAHRMYEQWHPLGNIGVITAFNFPAAVWSWNAMIAAVCGNSIVWKPSEVTPLIAVALTKLSHKVTKEHGFPGLFTLLNGDGAGIGTRMCEDRRFPLISATGSCRMGRIVAQTVGSRLGRSLLELGGNNAVIVMDDANLDLVVRAVTFGAVGTAGQRCTTTRRLLVHRSIIDKLRAALLKAFEQIPIGNPLEEGTLMGPLVNEAAVASYKAALAKIQEQGGEVLCGAEILSDMPSELYVKPSIVYAENGIPMMQEETFAPILYLQAVDSLEEAIQIQNAVPQGLSSAIFTDKVQSAELFLSQQGSDCGIANVNIGTSGAEVGGAFGGEKDTGGGREAGSDSWKAYMRRQTTTINWGKELPLAQGITFG